MAARFVTQRNPKCARKFNRAAFLVHGVQLKPPLANGKNLSVIAPKRERELPQID